MVCHCRAPLTPASSSAKVGGMASDPTDRAISQRERPPRVVFLDRETLPPEIVLRPLGFPHEMVTYGRTAPSEVAARIADADVVITNKVPVRGAALQAARSLRLVAIAATGHDNVDLGACAARNVTVCNIREYAVATVPEHTFA